MDKLYSLIDERYEKQKSSFSLYFRTIAGDRLLRCAEVPCNTIKDLSLRGNDVQLTNEILCNVVSLLEGWGSITNTNAKNLGILLNMRSTSPVTLNQCSYDDLAKRVCSEFNIVGSVGVKDDDSASHTDDEGDWSDEDWDDGDGWYEDEPDGYEDGELPTDDGFYEDGEADAIEAEAIEADGTESEGTESEYTPEDPPIDIAQQSDTDADNVLSSKKAKSILDFYAMPLDGIISELLKRYREMYSSGYEVKTFYGILSADGVLGLSGNSSLVKRCDIVTKRTYSMFESEMGIKELNVRSISGVAHEIYSEFSSSMNSGSKPRLLYFPYKMLEFAYGRCAPTGEKQEKVYMKHSNSADWAKYSNSEVNKNLRVAISKALLQFVWETSGCNIDNCFTDDMNSMVVVYLDYIKECLSTSILWVDFKTTKSEQGIQPVSVKIRVCDPRNALSNRDYMYDIIRNSFSGNKGVMPNHFPPRIDASLCFKEYYHEFDHRLNEAMPLFAYKALNSLKIKGKRLTWDNLILGADEDDSVLTNGKENSNGEILVNLSVSIIHHLIAGSRAGKGVMTMNMCAAALMSNKALFYLDNKPDMASFFRKECPEMFVINGPDYSDKYDDWGTFNNLDNELGVNIPDYIIGDGAFDRKWSSLGSIFYIRALKLVLGIIFYRGSTKDGATNPNLGGKDGIVLVVDEYTNLQANYVGNALEVFNKLVAPATYRRDVGSLKTIKNEGEREEKEEKINSAYGVRNYYSLAYLISMYRDVEYISLRNKAAFDAEEVKASDIFVIGQDISYNLMEDVDVQGKLSTADGSYRRRQSECGVKNYSDIKKQNKSIAWNLVNFKSMDAFYGRNMDGTNSEFLAQKHPDSKANGRLDDKASNFLYIPNYTDATRKTIKSGITKDNLAIANNPKNKYFKPYLILKDCLNNGRPDSSCGQLFNRCNDNGISKEEVIADNPNEDGTFLNSAVGFREYVESAGIDNFYNALAKSGKIAQYVVEKMGYKGTWFEFITDLRPEWLFSIEDVVNSLSGNALSDVPYSSNPILREFYEVHPEVFEEGNSEPQSDMGTTIDSFDAIYGSAMHDAMHGDAMGSAMGRDAIHGDSMNGDAMGSAMHDDAMHGDSMHGTECFATEVDTPVKEPTYMEDDDLSDYSNIEAQKDKLDKDMKKIFDDTDFYDDDEEIDFYDDSDDTASTDGFYNGGTIHDTARVSEEELLKNLIQKAYEKDTLINLLKSCLGDDYDIVKKGNNNNKPDDTDTYDYGKMAESTIDEDDGDIDFDSDACYNQLIEAISGDLISKFGGLSKISSFCVKGGSIAVNKYFYTAKVGGGYTKSMPYHIRQSINSGNIACMFDYGYLLEMQNLRELRFDSLEFVYDYVLSGLGFGKFIDVDRFFREFSKLVVLELGGTVFNRHDYKEKVMQDDVNRSIYYNPKSRTRLADATEGLLSRVSKGSWKFIKDSYSSNDYGKAMKAGRIVVGSAVGLAAGTAYMGTKATRGISRGMSGFKKGAKSFLKGIRDAFNEIDGDVNS